MEAIPMGLGPDLVRDPSGKFIGERVTVLRMETAGNNGDSSGNNGNSSSNTKGPAAELKTTQQKTYFEWRSRERAIVRLLKEHEEIANNPRSTPDQIQRA